MYTYAPNRYLMRKRRREWINNTSQAKMEHSNLSLSSSILILLLLFISSSESVTFNCTGTATCQSLAGFVAPNSTTYDAIRSLFQVPTLSDLLKANNLPLSTPASDPISANSVVRVPFPCACADGKGRSNHTPIYTIKPTDAGLDDIARLTFDLLISYEEIAEANNIAAPYRIQAGEKLWIPLPCSCDAVDGEKVVHLAYLVEPGDTINLIAENFGTAPGTLLRINGIGDPRGLQAGQAIDIPLKVEGVPAPTPSPSSGSDGSTPGGRSVPAGSSHASRRTMLQGNWMWPLMSIIAAFIGSIHRA